MKFISSYLLVMCRHTCLSLKENRSFQSADLSAFQVCGGLIIGFHIFYAEIQRLKEDLQIAVADTQRGGIVSKYERGVIEEAQVKLNFSSILSSDFLMPAWNTWNVRKHARLQSGGCGILFVLAW